MAQDKLLCIYHGNCDDGFGAAYAVWKALGDQVEFYPGHYGNPPPDVIDRDVLLVDFSYKRPVLLDMFSKCKTLKILDHHKSAMEDLDGIPGAEFDMNRSGAMMAWNHFHPDTRPPALIYYIQDRDLWRFEYPGTREFSLSLRSYPMDFEVWDNLNPDKMIEEGKIIARFYDKKIEELKTFHYIDEVAGHFVPVCNAPWAFASDLANELSKGYPFAATYYDTKDNRTYSLRSQENGMDVSKIAAQYGGGGHYHAAGFRIPRP